MTQGILTGIRVLDFGRYVAGPYAAAVLADFGADVIRIEPPAGGDDRFKMPLAEGLEGANYVQMARSKRSLTLDLSCDEGRAVMRRLVASADVVIANVPPRALKSMGLDYDTLAQIKPDIILAVGTAYGTGGPYSDWLGFDAMGQCLSGAVHMTGTAETPMRAQAAYCDYGTALYLTIGILAALMERRTSGKGQQVEASLLHTGLAFMSHFLAEQAVNRTNRPRTGNRGQTSGPIDLFRTSDGWVFVFALGDVQFRRLAIEIGHPEWIGDPRFADDALRGKNGEALSAGVAAWCADKTTDDILARLAAAKVPCGPMLTPQEALDDPHIKAMDFLKTVPFPGLADGVPVVDLPVRLSRTPAGIQSRAPLLGEHSDDVLASVGYSPSEIRDLTSKGVTSK